VEGLIEDLTRGNVTEVKVVLASVVLALAGYQVLLAAVAYGWLRLPFLAAGSASWTHRASGDVILLLTIVIATVCIGYAGFEDGGTHAVVATILLGVRGEGAGGPPGRQDQPAAAAARSVAPDPDRDHLADLGRRLPGGRLMAGRPPQGVQILGSLLVGSASSSARRTSRSSRT
jgi:hypothetical protein